MIFNDIQQQLRQNISQRKQNNLMSNKNSRLRTSESLIELAVLIGDYNVVLNVPKQTKIGDVISMIKSYDKIHNQYGPVDSKFIGLASLDQNQMVDYWLMNHNFNFARFKNKLAMKALYTNYEKPQKITINHFQFIKCLGEGACGSVFLVRSRITGQLFAMKRLNKCNLMSEDQFKSVFREQKILRTLPRSNYTVKFHASFESIQHFNFLLDYYPGGELFVHLSDRKLSQQQCKLYFCEILSSIEFLHRNNILYRDLKPQNVLVDAFGHLCIADFGLSKCGFRQQDIASSHCGSPDYMAPEMLQNKDYNFSSDFYSIGAILYQFLTGFPPYYDRNNRDDSQYLGQKLDKMRGMHLNLQNITKDRNLRNLIKGLLHPDPQLRISDFHMIKNSPWLTDIDWKIIEERAYQAPFIPQLYKSYINSQFLDPRKQQLVNRMNQYENQNFQSFQFFDYIRPQSEKLILGKPSTSSKQNHIMKKKNNGINRDKSKAKLKNANHTKGNISISLYEKEKHLHRQSRDDTATTVNSNVSAREAKSAKLMQTKEVNNPSIKRQGSKKNLLRKVPSSNKIVTAPSSHNVSDYSHRRVGNSKQKGLTLKTKNDLNKSKLALGISSTPMSKSKSKDKIHKTLGLGIKKQQGYMSTKSKKQILPVSSYKIKLM